MFQRPFTKQFGRIFPRRIGNAIPLLVALGGLAMAVACSSDPEPSPPYSPGDEPGAVRAPDVGIGKSGARRLSRQEYRDTVRDLFGMDHDPTAIPKDNFVPFDNDYPSQTPSQPYVDAAEAEAEAIAAKVLADPLVRNRIVGCTPSGVEDVECLTRFVTTFGKRVLRRPLAPEEVAELVGFQSIAREANDFNAAVDAVIRALLQNASFLYRIEIGTPVAGRAGVFRLDEWEVASRLSYFLWGSTPSDALLAAAEQGQLANPESRRNVITQMVMGDAKAKSRVLRFHALWLGYERLPHPADFADAARTETDALVSRAIFERKGSWLDMFASDDTYINQTLAQTYGLPFNGSGFQWVKYSDDRRRGILSHASFLSLGGKFGDTSPTLRGIAVRTRLFCEQAPSPPPNVNVDEPPAPYNGSNCKHDRYLAISATGCGNCHKPLDYVGFGLERFGVRGEYRDHEAEHPECALPDEGEIVGTGKFRGPAGLATMVRDSGVLEQCIAKQVYRFAMGRSVSADDQAAVDSLQQIFHDHGYKFDDLLVEFASAPWFGFRVEE